MMNRQVWYETTSAVGIIQRGFALCFQPVVFAISATQLRDWCPTTDLVRLQRCSSVRGRFFNSCGKAITMIRVHNIVVM